MLEVFVDDFIAATIDISIRKLLKISCAMLHGIHSIPPPPDVSGHDGHDPISEAKIDKSKGVWQCIKEIFGWIMNDINKTIKLPLKKSDKFCKQLKDIAEQKSEP
eukprot:11475234-Ditylum_brightwellii.AAC.1